MSPPTAKVVFVIVLPCIPGLSGLIAQVDDAPVAGLACPRHQSFLFELL